MSGKGLKVIASWSSGKDSCLACYKAIKMGYTVKCLFNTISNDSKRVRFHGVNKDLLKKQAEAVSIPLYQIETTPDGYIQEFKDAVRKLMERDGIWGMVFGDIFLEEHKKWIDDVCNDLGIKAIMPLWNKESEEVINEFINLGFEAIVVGVWTKNIKNGNDWLGRKIEKEFIDYVKSYESIDLCGENGEYHTFVTNGPLFKKRINILKTEKVYIEREYKGEIYGNWFLDIKEFRLDGK
jgi:uncharacterized protein (TIGR00290 family)